MILLAAAYVAAIAGVTLNLTGHTGWGSYSTYCALTLTVFWWVGRYIDHHNEQEQL